MSRHLLIRCDRAGCSEQTETRASDTQPTAIGVPGNWYTLSTEGVPDKHYCSIACIQLAFPLAGITYQESPAKAGEPVSPSPYATPAAVIPVEKPTLPRRKKA